MSDAVAVAAPGQPEDPKPAHKPTIQDRLSEKAKPGAEMDKTKPPGLWQGSGQADGVIWLGERKRYDGVTLKKDLFPEAMRYLKGNDLQWCVDNPGRRGRCKPDVFQILMQPQNLGMREQILSMSQETIQPVEWTFRMTKHETVDRGINAVQPEHIKHWYVVPTESEGVWAVFYV